MDVEGGSARLLDEIPAVELADECMHAYCTADISLYCVPFSFTASHREARNVGEGGNNSQPGV